MATAVEQSAPAEKSSRKRKRKRRWWKVLGTSVLVLVILLIAARMAMPGALRWYVNRTINQSPLYDGEIGDIDVHLWRGAYSIEDIRLLKTTGNVPVPLFAAKRVDLAVQWDALLAGEVVGRILFDQPELNFVDGENESEDQTGAGGPWLKIIDELFPFRINEARVRNGSMHFRAFGTDPPVDVYLASLEATVENLSNIHDDVAPLIATVTAKAQAMGHADLQYQMKLDPSSYHPTFQMAVRLIGLDVTKLNSLTRAYGAFDFEHGFFDLVVELDAKHGQLEGYVKPLFRDIDVLSLRDDVKEDDVLRVFWEALVGTASGLLENQPRDQFATVIPLRGNVSSPKTNILSAIGNILRNAFIRAYLPKLQGTAEDIDLQFGPGTVADPITPGDL